MSRTILIAAGGTGGHIFPGLAAAARLQAMGCNVVWLGARGGMEADLVPRHGLGFYAITVAGWRGQGITGLLRAPVALLRALRETARIFASVRPDCVLGMGGFAAGPAGLLAGFRKMPLVVHEQNAIPGLTNRWLARLATRVLQAFDGTFKDGRATTVGNPVRETVSALPSPSLRGAGAHQPGRLLVLGGSRGAQALNETVGPAVAAMIEKSSLSILHQAGRGKADACQRAYAEAGVQATVVEFIDDMAAAYAEADLVIARAGALTLSELAAAGLGAILVPYPWAADDHQTANARHFEQVGAAVVLPQSDLSPERLAHLLASVLHEPGRMARMAERARGLATPDADRRVAEICMEVAG